MAHLARSKICKFSVSSVCVLARIPLLQQLARQSSFVPVQKLSKRKTKNGFVELEILISKTNTLIAHDRLDSTAGQILLPLVCSDKLMSNNDRKSFVQKIYDNLNKKDVHFYNTYIQAMIDNNVEFSVDKLLQDMEASEVIPNQETFLKLIVKCCEDQNLKVASGFITYMKDNNIKIPIECFVHIAKAKCAVGETHKALEIFSHMMENNYPLRWSDISVLCCGLVHAGQTKEFKDIISQYEDRVATKMPVRCAIPIFSVLQKKDKSNDLLPFFINHVYIDTEDSFLDILDACDGPNLSNVLKKLYTKCELSFPVQFDRLAEGYLFDTVKQAQDVDSVQNEVLFLRKYHPQTDLNMVVLPLLARYKKHLMLDYLTRFADNLSLKPQYILPLLENQSDLNELKANLPPGLDVDKLFTKRHVEILDAIKKRRTLAFDYGLPEQQLYSSLSETLKLLWDVSIPTQDIAKKLWDQLEIDLPQTMKFRILSKSLIFKGCLNLFSTNALKRYNEVQMALKTLGFEFDKPLLHWCYRKLPKHCHIPLELIWFDVRKIIPLRYLSKILESPPLVAEKLSDKYETRTYDLLFSALHSYNGTDQMKEFKNALKSNNSHLDSRYCNMLFWHFVSVGQVSDLKSLFANYIVDDDITSVPAKYLECWSDDLADFLLGRFSDKFDTSYGKLILYLSLLEGKNYKAAEKMMENMSPLTRPMRSIIDKWSKVSVHKAEYGYMCTKFLTDAQSVLEQSDFLYLVNTIILSLATSSNFKMIKYLLNNVYQLLSEDMQKQISSKSLQVVQEHFLHENKLIPVEISDKRLFKLVTAALHGQLHTEEYLTEIQQLKTDNVKIPHKLLTLISRKINFDEFDDFQTKLKIIFPDFSWKKQTSLLVFYVKGLLDSAGVKEVMDFVTSTFEKPDANNIGMWKEVVGEICHEAYSQGNDALLESIGLQFAYPSVSYIVKAHQLYRSLAVNQVVLNDLKDPLPMRHLIKLISVQNDENAMAMLEEIVSGDKQLLGNYVAGQIASGEISSHVTKYMSSMTVAEIRSLCPLAYTSPESCESLIKVDAFIRDMCPIHAQLNYYLALECANFDVYHSPKLFEYLEKKMHEIPWVHNYHKATQIFADLQHCVLFRPSNKSTSELSQDMVDQVLAVANKS